MEAKAIKEKDRHLGVVLAFNVKIFPDAEIESDESHIKIFEDKICEHVSPFEAKRKVAVRSFLSLNGKPDKFMRLRQVVLYWQRRLMNKGLITLTRTQEDIEKYPDLQNYYNDIKDLINKTDYNKLCKHWPNPLDDHNINKGLYGKHFSGYPFDKKGLKRNVCDGHFHNYKLANPHAAVLHYYLTLTARLNIFCPILTQNINLSL